MQGVLYPMDRLEDTLLLDEGIILRRPVVFFGLAVLEGRSDTDCEDETGLGSFRNDLRFDWPALYSEQVIQAVTNSYMSTVCNLQFTYIRMQNMYVNTQTRS